MGITEEENSPKRKMGSPMGKIGLSRIRAAAELTRAKIVGDDDIYAGTLRRLTEAE